MTALEAMVPPGPVRANWVAGVRPVPLTSRVTEPAFPAVAGDAPSSPRPGMVAVSVKPAVAAAPDWLWTSMKYVPACVGAMTSCWFGLNVDAVTVPDWPGAGRTPNCADSESGADVAWLASVSSKLCPAATLTW